MTENTIASNSFTTELRVDATNQYIKMWLHPDNNHRHEYFMNAVLVGCFIYNAPVSNKHAKAMTESLNQRLHNPLSSNEKLTAIEEIRDFLNEDVCKFPLH
ncbi:hypothetical protein JOC36_000229 [Weissella uvarum]|uniref:hypothetical protein n=1 Tax=Weissella uvarum TaxID=1479233 RepID=UPI001960A7AF|nr:hypothetical protein [Weissella uvarum]MBM7616696.1 hypothetical protein [Weissella uvarum]MCM0594849.1 hypothetical protein [Weissella uvarum]